MKKLGIILIALFVWIAATEAQSKDTIAKSDTTQAIVVTPNPNEKLYINDNLDLKESILLQKLTPEQIMELEELKIHNDRNSDMPFSSGVLLLIIIIPFIMVILIVFITSIYKNKESARKHQLYMKAIETGHPIQESYFKEKETEEERKKSSNFQKGVIWSAVGVALILSSLVLAKEIFAVGIIPACIGAAYLLMYFIEDRKNTSNNQ